MREEEDLDFENTDEWKQRRSMESKMGRHYPGMKTIHPCISRALSGRHILLIGTTGSGKSFVASYMTKFMDAFLFINVQEEKSASDACQVLLEDPEDLQEALEDGYRGIEFVPSMDRDTAIEEIEVIRQQLFEIGSEMKLNADVLELPFWFNVFLDEAQIFVPKHTHKDAENFFTRGRGYGIKTIAITRAPQEVSSEVINDIEYQIIFKLGQFAYPYFNSYKIPIEEEREWIMRQYHFVLYDGFVMVRCKPI